MKKHEVRLTPYNTGGLLEPDAHLVHAAFMAVPNGEYVRRVPRTTIEFRACYFADNGIISTFECEAGQYTTLFEIA